MVTIVFTENDKWAMIDGLDGWIRLDVIYRLTISTYQNSSLKYLNIYYSCGGESDYWAIRLPTVENGQFIIDELIKRLGKVI